MTEEDNIQKTPEELVSAEQLAQIDPNNLVEEMSNTPAVYGRYTELYVEADRLAALQAVQVDRLKAVLLLHYKAQGGSTEAGYKSMVECDEQYVEARMRLVATESRAKALLHKTKAIDKKLNQLTNHGMRINTEIRANPMAAAQANWGGRVGNSG